MGKYVPSTGQVPTGSTDRRVARPHDDAETEGLQRSPKLKVMGRRGWAHSLKTQDRAGVLGHWPCPYGLSLRVQGRQVP